MKSKLDNIDSIQKAADALDNFIPEDEWVNKDLIQQWINEQDGLEESSKKIYRDLLNEIFDGRAEEGLTGRDFKLWIENHLLHKYNYAVNFEKVLDKDTSDDTEEQPKPIPKELSPYSMLRSVFEAYIKYLREDKIRDPNGFEVALEKLKNLKKVAKFYRNQENQSIQSEAIVGDMLRFANKNLSYFSVLELQAIQTLIPKLEKVQGSLKLASQISGIEGSTLSPDNKKLLIQLFEKVFGKNKEMSVEDVKKRLDYFSNKLMNFPGFTMTNKPQTLLKIEENLASYFKYRNNNPSTSSTKFFTEHEEEVAKAIEREQLIGRRDVLIDSAGSHILTEENSTEARARVEEIIKNQGNLWGKKSGARIHYILTAIDEELKKAENVKPSQLSRGK